LGAEIYFVFLGHWYVRGGIGTGERLLVDLLFIGGGGQSGHLSVTPGGIQPPF
jgi:hypothetical protein